MKTDSLKTDVRKLACNKKTVTQDNALIESCYSMTLNEKRVLLLGISKINPTLFPKKSEPESFTITAKEFSEVFPDNENPWRALKRAVIKLRPRYVELHSKNNDTAKQINWFDSIEYSNGLGTVTVRFSWSMHVRLAGMSDHFTKFPILEIRKLSNMYGVRLFELLFQFKSTGYRIITIEKYRFSMDCVNKYNSIAELKRNTLTPAINDLRNNSNLDVNFKTIKSGHKITHFQFFLNLNKSL
jgi:plasmid replication initiation protein